MKKKPVCCEGLQHNVYYFMWEKMSKNATPKEEKYFKEIK